jgi:hypothetical protein
MKAMAVSKLEVSDLLDLKLLPAWVKEPAARASYERYGAEDRPEQTRGRRPRRSRGKSPNAESSRRRRERRLQNGPRKSDLRRKEPRAPAQPTSPAIAIRFLPNPAVFENVVAQIKSESLAYSLLALARLFLEKPGRYDVCLKATAERPLHRLGDNGMLAIDRDFLERNAFRFACEEFYKVDVTQSEPIKGNFSNVARCRLSGTLLGPTNYHTYQPQLRALYEQRFSRRMSFAEYVRHVELVNEPALIERWKEEARKISTFTTLREEVPASFASAADAERHFRSRYLPNLIRPVEEATIGGVASRRAPDRVLHRAIEEAWAREMRSPSNLIQELAARFRQAGLHLFRHRRGMLFVSPTRVRPFLYDQAGVSPGVKAILETLAGRPGIRRKELLEKLTENVAPEEVESRKLCVASDLRWLIDEGYVIEFNDGSLDLPRARNAPLPSEQATARNHPEANGLPQKISAPALLALPYSWPTTLNGGVEVPPS